MVKSKNSSNARFRVKTICIVYLRPPSATEKRVSFIELILRAKAHWLISTLNHVILITLNVNKIQCFIRFKFKVIIFIYYFNAITNFFNSLISAFCASICACCSCIALVNKGTTLL
jgi:hypothetical protein